MKRYIISSFFVLVFAATPVHGFQENFTKEEKLVALNIGASLAITAWGIVFWDYGEHSPSMKNERWFQKDTDKGGMDKFGHFYSNYVLSHGFSFLYESCGYECDKAALYGAMSSFGLMGFMELADSTGEFGFSHEDFTMNFLGSCAGYFLSMHPDIAKRIDFRIEYIPIFQNFNIVTDYERMRFLVAFKLDGFEAVTNKYLKYLELHLGYYANGYKESDNERSRNIYAGLGINISRIFNDLSYKKTSKFFNYYQLPYTYIKFNKDLDE